MTGYSRTGYFLSVFLAGVVPVFGQTHPDLGSLNDYEVKGEVWLASGVGDVLVDPEFPLEITTLGKIGWAVADGAKVEKDQMICEFAANDIALSERELALRKSRYANSLSDLETSNRESKKGLELQIAELKEALAEIKLTPTEKEVLGSAFLERLTRERGQTEKELAALEKKLNGTYFEEQLANDRADLNLELDRAQQVHNEMVTASQVFAFTDGFLIILKDEVTRKEEPVGKIVKKDEAEAIIEIKDPRLRNLNPSKLAIEITGDDGKKYSGTYTRTLEQKAFAASSPSYAFGIKSAEDGEKVPGSLSGNRLLRINYILPQEGHIVPKSELIFRFPEEINEGGWLKFIQKRWPGVELVYVGPKHLVVRKADDN